MVLSMPSKRRFALLFLKIRRALKKGDSTVPTHKVEECLIRRHSDFHYGDVFWGEMFSARPFANLERFFEEVFSAIE